MTAEGAYERIVEQIEDLIRSATHEIAYVVDPDGTVIGRQEGERTYVDLPAETLRGRIITHNHPRGTSLSIEDVRTLVETGAREMRVVSSRYDYSLRVPPETAWGDVELLIEDVYRRVLRETVQASRSGRLTPDEASVRVFHEVWSEVADIRGWSYTRRSRL